MINAGAVASAAEPGAAFPPSGGKSAFPGSLSAPAKRFGPTWGRENMKGAVRVRMRKIEGVALAAPAMGRVRGVSFRRNRSMVLGEMAVFVLNVQPGLNAAQIKDRINAAARQYQFNNSTLGWILARTPGVIVVRKTPSHSATYQLETEREADLPEATQDRLMKSLELFHPPSGDDGN